MSEQIKKIIKRSFKGAVVSTKMDKTVVVRVDRTKVYPKYGKRIKVSRRYKIHDSKNECQVGDVVLFVECKPFSKDKKWRFIKKLED